MSGLVNYNFPVLGKEYIYYKDKYSYGCSISTQSNTAEERVTAYKLTHKLKGGGLISKLITEKKARFGCIVSIRSTLYRKTFISDTAKYDNPANINHQQIIKIPQSYGILNPPSILPMVVYYDNKDYSSKGDIECLNLGEEDFTFSKSDIIARDTWQLLRGKTLRMILLEDDKDLPHGSIGNIKIEEADGGKFIVKVSSDLCRIADIRNAHSDSIHTHILAKCLKELHSNLQEESNRYQDCLGILALIEIVKKKCKNHNLSEIDDPDGDFDADLAACILKPHIMQEIEEGD